MKNRAPKLIQTLFTLGFFSVVISMVLAYSLISQPLGNYFVKTAVTKNTEIANSISTLIEDKLNDAVTQLKLIEESIKLDVIQSAQINELLLDMNLVSTTFVAIEVIDFDGRVLFTLPEFVEEIGFDRSRESFYTEFSLPEEVFWSSVQLSPFSDSNTITVAIHSHLGFLVGYLDLTDIQALSEVFVSQFGLKKDITITDQNGVFLVNKDPRLVQQRRIDPHHPMALKILSGENLYLHLEDDGNKLVITSSQIDRTLWIVSITEPYNDAVAGIDFMIQILMAFTGFMLFGYALLLWRGNKKVIKDIQVFSQRLSDASQGLNTQAVKGYFKEFESLHATFNDMTDKISDRDRKLTNLAYHDSLTGFYNRSYLEDVLINQLQQNQEPYAVAYLDLDNFSHVNDSYGHHVGDQLLVEFSLLLKNNVPSTTDVIRLGGDEFILIIHCKQDVIQVAQDVVESIMSISNEPIKCDDRTIYFTVSAGLSFFPQDGDHFWTLLKNADAAMYTVKAEGKNSFRAFTKSMNTSVEVMLAIEQQLRPAMKNDEFSLEFQPQLSIQGHNTRGFEALLRWKNSILGSVSPIDFIAVAEENRMIIPLGKWVMKKSCESIKHINEHFKSQYIMAVNVSPIELKEPNYVQQVIEIVKEANIDPHWLEIEITENISIDSFGKLSETLNKLHHFGISISIDDFGTGYSSLAYLQKIPLDVLKVDRSFITHLGEENDQNLMTETIFLMAKKLGLVTIAEGVETQEHIHRLTSMNCDFMQGYYLSRPLTFDKLLKYIEDQRANN